MFDVNEAIDDLIDLYNESVELEYAFEKYNTIFEELQNRVDNGELALEDAEILNDIAYNKYANESTAMQRHKKFNSDESLELGRRASKSFADMNDKDKNVFSRIKSAKDASDEILAGKESKLRSRKNLKEHSPSDDMEITDMKDIPFMIKKDLGMKVSRKDEIKHKLKGKQQLKEKQDNTKTNKVGYRKLVLNN